MKKDLSLLLCVCVFALTSSICRAQANINEGLETAFIYVDVVHGSDTTGTGTITNPYQTIGKGVSVAVANNQAGIGTQVNIQPGTYRESLSIGNSVQSTSLPMTFQAVTNGTVILDGATVMTGWTVYSGNSKIFTNNWTFNFSTCAQAPGCPGAQSIVLQQPMLAVNGVVMTQVLSITQLQPGSFYVDQTGGTIYLYPPSGTNVNTATIETATEPALWTLVGASNIVLRGLVFQYANSCRANAAVSLTGAATNVLLDTLAIQWNNGQGLSIANPSANFTVQNTISNHNGDSGFQETQTLNGLWTNDTASFNNWRGGQGAFYACNVGGAHPFQAHSDTLNGMTFAYNQAYGIHWDTDNQNITATNIVSTNNMVSAAFSEKNEGPITISSSHLCNSSALLGGGGFSIRNSTNISYQNSTIANAAPTQIAIIGTPGGIQVTNWQTGQVYNLITSDFTNTNNVIEGVGSTQQVFSDATLGGSDWTAFQTTLNSNNNTWWNASNSIAAFEVPTPKNDSPLTFSGWQTTTGQDLNSTFSAPSTDPAAACNAITPDMPDYWLFIDNTALTMNPVGQATFNLTGTPLNFSGTLSLLEDGTSGISGLTAAFSPSTISLSGGNAASAALTLTALTTTPAGTYPFTVVANNGNITHMVTAQVTVPAPGFRLSTVLLAFPSQQINTSGSPMAVTLTNNGSAATSITSIVSSLTAFTQTNNCGTSLAAHASCTVNVTFKPTTVQTFSGTLTFTDADSTSPQVVTLTGTGTNSGPSATLLPSTLNFGSVNVGSTSVAMTSILTNTNLTLSLSIRSIAISGANASEFQLTSATTCPSSGVLAALGTCIVSVTFTPGASGARSATLTVTDNASGGSQTVALSGTGSTGATATATLLPATLSFGTVAVGSTSAAKSSTLTDTSTTIALNISSITITGTNAADFKLSTSSTCPGSGTINPLATCLVTVTFSPSASGSRSATLTVFDNTSAGSQTVALSGTGSGGTTATATLLPASLSFGTVAVGSTSAAKSSTLTDTSTTIALNISSITITGTNAADFKLSTSSTCPNSGTINPLATCLVTITFSPTASGARSATLTVFDNTSTGSQTVALSGTGSGGSTATATLLPASLSFGTVAVGSTSAAKSSTLTDTSTTIALNISSITITGTNASDFKLSTSSTCPSSGTINPQANCLVTVTFSPAASGARSATLTVFDNTSTGSQTVALSGTGSGGSSATATLLPSSLSFGTVSVGSTSAAQSSTLTDTSTTIALNISSITITGSNASDFKLSTSSTCPSSGTINPLATCLVTVTFSPAASGARSATLTVFDNTTAGSQTVALSGTGGSGSTATATLLPSSLSFGSLAVGSTSAAKSSTLADTSATVALNISSITITGANAADFKLSSSTTCPSSGTINPLTTCTVSVTFSPTATGARSATLTVFDNTSTGSQTLALSGTGTTALATATLLPSSLSFGTVTVGTTSAAKSSTLTDTSATVALNISSIAITGTNPTDFTLTPASTCPASGTVNPLATCLVTVTFTPSASGTRSATLTVTDNTSAGKQSVVLAGTGK
ncbi:MAG TPA: choice-of-anchor D domain-containing protein [Candidatus Sulfotelmatobacter sp.]